MKRITGADIGTAILVLCAVLVTGLVVRREFHADDALSKPFFQAVPNSDALAKEGQVFGSADALVRIVEFSDFECPACARAQKDLKRVRELYPEDVAIVYRHFPLDATHRYARVAAAAAECAGEQNRFESYHDALYADQHAIGLRKWESFAEIAGVPDLSAFRICVAEGRYMERVERDAQAGERAGVAATPTFIVNGQMFSGTVPEGEWVRLVRRALATEQARRSH